MMLCLYFEVTYKKMKQKTLLNPFNNKSQNYILPQTYILTQKAFNSRK